MRKRITNLKSYGVEFFYEGETLRCDNYPHSYLKVNKRWNVRVERTYASYTLKPASPGMNVEIERRYQKYLKNLGGEEHVRRTPDPGFTLVAST